MVPGFHSINAANRLISSAAFALVFAANAAAAAHSNTNKQNRFLFMLGSLSHTITVPDARCTPQAIIGREKNRKDSSNALPPLRPHGMERQRNRLWYVGHGRLDRL